MLKQDYFKGLGPEFRLTNCPALTTTWLHLFGPHMYLWTSSLSNQPSPSRC